MRKLFKLKTNIDLLNSLIVSVISDLLFLGLAIVFMILSGCYLPNNFFIFLILSIIFAIIFLCVRSTKLTLIISKCRLLPRNHGGKFTLSGSSYMFSFTIVPYEQLDFSIYLITIFLILLSVKYRAIIKSHFIQILLLLIITFTSFLMPSFQYFFMLFVSGILLLLSTTFLDNYIPYKSYIAYELLLILNHIKLIPFLEKLYFNFFDKPRKIFIIKTSLIYFFSLLYVFISKYLYINRDEIHNMNFSLLIYIYICLFISLLFIYYRMLLTASIIVNNIAMSNINKFEEIPPSSASDQKPTSQIPKANRSNYSLFSYTRNQHYYQQPASNAFRFKVVGIGVGVGTMFIGGYAAYQQRLQTIAAQESLRVSQEALRAQELNNFEMSRQNDLAELEQKILSVEEYRRRYPLDKSSK